MSTHQHIDKLYAQLKLLHCGVLTEMHLRFIYFFKNRKQGHCWVTLQECFFFCFLLWSVSSAMFFSQHKLF